MGKKEKKEKKEKIKRFSAKKSIIDGKEVFLQNSLISDTYLSLAELKEKCWEQMLEHSFSYLPYDDKDSKHYSGYQLTIGSHKYLVDPLFYPEIHTFFLTAGRIYSQYQDLDPIEDVPEEEKKIFFQALQNVLPNLAEKEALRLSFSPNDSEYNEFKIMNGQFCMNLLSVLCMFGAFFITVPMIDVIGWGMIPIEIFSAAIPLAAKDVWYRKNYEKATKKYQVFLEQNNVSLENENNSKSDETILEDTLSQEDKLMISPTVTSFEEVYDFIKALPSSSQKNAFSLQLKDLMDRYLSADDMIEKLPTELERSQQRNKVDAVFQNQLLFLRQDVVNYQHQSEENLTSIQRLKNLRNELQTSSFQDDDVALTLEEVLSSDEPFGTSSEKVVKIGAKVPIHKKK